jgi:hypothetical protein
LFGAAIAFTEREFAMIHRLLFLVALGVGSLTFGASSSDGGHAHFGRAPGCGYPYRPVYSGVAVYRPPAVVTRSYYGAYGVPAYRYQGRSYLQRAPAYRSYYSPYADRYIGPRIGIGYGSYYRRGPSIGIGF